MPQFILKQKKRERRKIRVRAGIKGTANRPRMSLFRSNRHIWVQLINDIDGETTVAASDLELKARDKKSKKLEIAERIGGLVAEKALEKNIEKVVFDRGSYKFHGIVRAVAEGARKRGLKF